MDTMNRIISALKEKGKKQKELTDYLGLDKSTFSQWKNGTSNSYTKYYFEIAKFLEVPVSFLVDDPISAAVDKFADNIFGEGEDREICYMLSTPVKEQENKKEPDSRKARLTKEAENMNTDELIELLGILHDQLKKRSHSSDD